MIRIYFMSSRIAVLTGSICITKYDLHISSLSLFMCISQPEPNAKELKSIFYWYNLHLYYKHNMNNERKNTINKHIFILQNKFLWINIYINSKNLSV